MAASDRLEGGLSDAQAWLLQFPATAVSTRRPPIARSSHDFHVDNPLCGCRKRTNRVANVHPGRRPLHRSWAAERTSAKATHCKSATMPYQPPTRWSASKRRNGIRCGPIKRTAHVPNETGYLVAFPAIGKADIRARQDVARHAGRVATGRP
jgi:hypothetical protein